MIAAALAFMAIASLRALLDGIALKVVSVPPSADAVTGHPLPASLTGQSTAEASNGPRPVSGHQERKEGER